MIDLRSEVDHGLCTVSLGCEEALLSAVRRNIAIDDEENGVGVARMLEFKGAARSIKGLVSEQIAVVESEWQLASQLRSTIRIIVSSDLISSKASRCT